MALASSANSPTNFSRGVRIELEPGPGTDLVDVEVDLVVHQVLHEVVEGFKPGLVVLEAFLHLIHAHGLAEAVGDVGEVGEGRGMEAVGDMQVRIDELARADGLDEVEHVVGALAEVRRTS